MQPGFSLPHSQEFAVSLDPEKNKFSPEPLILFL